jgi:hypothetical protein
MGRDKMTIKVAAEGRRPDPRRDVLYFLAGPALIAAGAAAAFHVWPWPVPIASQAQVFQPLVVASILLAGLAGVAVSSRAGLPSAPALRDGKAWGRIVLASVGGGVLFGAALLGLDALFGVTAGAAKALGATWVNVPLPASLAHYAAGGVLVECLYRLAPIPILGWLIGTALLKKRAQTTVFWSLAIVTSMLEPAAQLALVRPGAIGAVTGMVILTFAANLFEALEFRRFGWPAPILFRLAFYAVWHCFGPYLSAPSSVLYPGPHP